MIFQTILYLNIIGDVNSKQKILLTNEYTKPFSWECCSNYPNFTLVSMEGVCKLGKFSTDQLH